MKSQSEWLISCSRTPAHSMRFSLWCEALADWPLNEAATLIDYAARRTRTDADALAAWLGLVDFPALLARVGAQRLHDILEEAESAGLCGCALVLGSGAKVEAPKEIAPPPDRISESLTLGHRKTAARGMRSHLLDRILKDPDPAVVAEILRNPRLREREVVAIASRRPAPEAVFWLLASAPQWMSRLPLRRAVVLNPYAPPRLAVTLAVTLNAGDLSFVVKQERLHRVVREGALEMLKWSAAG